MSGGGGWGGRELSEDPFGGEATGWEEIEGGAAPARPAHDPIAGGGGRVLGDPFDGLGDAPGALPGLELDPVATRREPTGAQRTFARPTENDAAPGDVAPGEERDPRDAVEIAALADYGPAPSGILGTVPYAVLVLTRRHALKKSLVDLLRLRARARADASEALIELGRALHARKREAALAPLSAPLGAADRAGRVAGEKTNEWEKSRQVADAQRASLTQKIAEVERKAGPYRDRETKLATQMSVREQDLRRAKARLARAEIELRNLASASASEADTARIPLLEAERVARQAEVATAEGHVQELTPQLAEARRELAVMVQAQNDLEAQRRAVDQAQGRTERAHLSTASAAEREYHEAVQVLATEALSRHLAEAVAPVQTKAARLMITARDTREREVALHEAALTVYDVKAFQTGAALLGGAALVILAMLVLVILR